MRKLWITAHRTGKWGLKRHFSYVAKTNWDVFDPLFKDKITETITQRDLNITYGKHRRRIQLSETHDSVWNV